MLEDLLELHEECSDGIDTWCDECIETSNGYGIIKGLWPCRTVEIILRHNSQH